MVQKTTARPPKLKDTLSEGGNDESQREKCSTFGPLAQAQAFLLFL